MDDALPFNDDILVNYLDGVLSPSEKASLELQLQQDAGLKERLRNLRMAVGAVQQYGTKEKVASIHSEMMQELGRQKKTAKVLPFRKLFTYGLTAAASIILIVVAINFFSRPNAQKLYDEAYVDYDASATRGSSNTTTLQEKYGAHDYNGVVSEAASGKLSRQDSFLVGLSYLKTGRPSPAIQWLQHLTTGSSYTDDAQFYLSLAYLKNKNYKEALPLMQAIGSNPANIYHGQFPQNYVDRVKKLAD
jgi:TolA-binding protein